MKKILLFGPEVTDFLNPLAMKLKQLGYTVDLIENRKSPRNNISITESYSTVLDYLDIVGKRISIADILRYLLKKEFIKKFFKEVFVNCLEGKCKIIQSFKNCLNNQLLKERFTPILNNYDIINFHSLSPSTLAFTDFIKPDKKVILSFWGSDLYQINGIKNYIDQINALKRADLITLQSYEMELTVLAKFGSVIKGKIVRALFGINDSVFDKLDKIKDAGLDTDFLKKYCIPENKIKVTICYCGNPVCNQIPIINELEKLNETLKDKIHLMVPMTYGNYSTDYLEEIKLLLHRSKITFTLLEKYLPYEDVLKMRVSSDIMIMMNKSDALSQSVSEFLYAENILISAAWLPYSPFRLKEIFMYESDFPGLSEMVSNAVKNLQTLKNNLKENPQKVKNLTAFSNLWQQWPEMLENLN
jgi:uncharacterized protein YutD